MTDQSPPPKLALKGLCKRFGDKVVLDNLDLDIMTGESVVIIGASGTGKSVMLKCILGLMTPEEGTIFFEGVDTQTMNNAGRDQMLRKFGMLFQGSALFDSLPVWENVSFGLLSAGQMGRAAAEAHAIDTLATVGLGSDVARLYPAALSGGMKKRVALARAIASSPEVIFFDEPTTGLDPITADVINNLIVERVTDLGATTLTITHDMGSVRKIATRVGLLHGGRIVWIGGVENLDNSGNDYVDQFIHGRAKGPITTDVQRGN